VLQTLAPQAGLCLAHEQPDRRRDPNTSLAATIHFYLTSLARRPGFRASDDSHVDSLAAYSNLISTRRTTPTARPRQLPYDDPRPHQSVSHELSPGRMSMDIS